MLSMRTQWRWLLPFCYLVQLGTIAAIFVAGCGPRIYTWKMQDWYSTPTRIVPKGGLDPVAIYSFIDRRGFKDEKLIGEGFLQVGKILSPEKSAEFYADEPTAKVVTRAFTEGFRALGVPVVRFQRRDPGVFNLGDHPDRSEATRVFLH